MVSRKIVIINGHPAEESFSEKLTTVYADAASESGHHVKVFHLHALEFDPIRRAGYGSDIPLEACLKEIQEAIILADHLVFVYPTWWGGMPALLKGFFERTFIKDVAFHYEEGKSLPVQLLRGKSADILTTMDAPCFYYRLFQGAPGDKMIKNAILGFCGVKPIKFMRFDSMRKATEEKLTKWIIKVEERAKNL